MNFKYKAASLLCAATLMLTGCEEELGRVVFPYSSPQMSELKVSTENQIAASDSIFFSVNIRDNETPLSTLEVTVTSGDELIHSESIRTKGYESSIKNHGVLIPFTPGMEDKEATLTLTAINVEGSEQKEVRKFKIVRPEMPETIFLHLDGEVLPMTRTEIPYEYATEEGSFADKFTGKISTSENLSDSKFIWGSSETLNHAALVAESGAGFTANYENWQIERITFNVQSFKVGVVGTHQVLIVNGVELEAAGGCYKGVVNFKKDAPVEISGFENLASAYNRDFFSFNEETGSLTFLRDSGEWEVYYYPKYNYMWIARVADVAPEAFWLVGHGFSSAPVWHEDFSYGGWDTEEVCRMAYAVKVAPGKYQTTIYLSTEHEWESFELEIYSDRQWTKDNGILLSEGAIKGDATGIIPSQSNGLAVGEGFVPGYYRLTFDTSAGVGKETVFIERIAD